MPLPPQDPDPPRLPPAWAGCSSPGCTNLTCLWAGLALCYPHSEIELGKLELLRRYNLTHPANPIGESF